MLSPFVPDTKISAGRVEIIFYLNETHKKLAADAHSTALGVKSLHQRSKLHKTHLMGVAAVLRKGLLQVQLRD